MALIYLFSAHIKKIISFNYCMISTAVHVYVSMFLDILSYEITIWGYILSVKWLWLLSIIIQFIQIYIFLFFKTRQIFYKIDLLNLQMTANHDFP